MFHVFRNGQQYGPYSADAIRGYLADGSLLDSDLVLEEGAAQWQPIRQVFRVTPPPPPPPHPPLQPQPPAHRAGTTTPGRLRHRTLTAVFLLLVLLLAAWLFFIHSPQKVALLEGSTTIGDALAPRLLIAFLKIQGATDIEQLPPSPANKDHRDVRAKLPGQWRPVIFSIVANGSGNAFKALSAGRVSIGMASRPINDREVDSLSALGDMRSPASENIVALDGIAIIVNDANAVSSLTRQQVAAIFAGKVTDWSRVGQPPGPIHIYGRGLDSKSGTLDTFVALVFAGNNKSFSPALRVEANGEAIASAVARDPGAIGYVALAQIGPAKAVALSDGPATTPLLPSPFTIATEDYILSRRLFLYTPASPDEFTRNFIHFALGRDGQNIVEEVGFVKQTPILEQWPVPPEAPALYRDRVSGLRRMSLNFRFRPGVVVLDNKALADLPRAYAALRQEGIHTGVQILGFADSLGSAHTNQIKSDQRAQAVADKLRAYGVDVQPIGFSSAMPVGDNATEEGREKNRRVEVWAK